MSDFCVEFTRSAAKEFSRLPEKLRSKITDALRLLRLNPFSELLKVKKLKGAENLFRIRFGDHRLVYQIRQERLIILIIKIGHRRELYR